MYKTIHIHRLRAGSLFATTVACCLFASALTASAVTVKVDSTALWEGFNNVTSTNGFSEYLFGSEWALEDLRADFVQTNSNPSGFPLNDYGVFLVNTNTFAPGTGDPPDTNYWNFSDGTPNKFIEANFFSNHSTNYAGDTVTFEGTIISNSIPLAPLGATYLDNLPGTGTWFVVAWVKTFSDNGSGAPGGFLGITTTANLGVGPFSVSRAVPSGGVSQHGFLIYGPNTAPGSSASLGELRFAVEDSDPGFVTQPVDAEVIVPDPVDLTAVAVGATALTYQWQKDGTNVVDGGAISGATTTNLVISPSAESDAGDYTCVVIDTAGSATSDVASVSIVNILVTSLPEDQRVPVGSDVVFNVAATSSVALTYRWFYVDSGGATNFIGFPFPYQPPSLDSGWATDTLSLTNVQLSDTGDYGCRIYDGTSFLFTETAELLVRTCSDWVNFLENPGFEEGNKTNESPWVRFASSDPGAGAFQDATDFYFGGGNVDIYDGTYVSFTTYHDTWAGIYQDVAVEPGQVFVAKMNFYNASGDPIPSGAGITNQTYLEIQFRDAGDNVLQQYTTDLDAMASSNLPPQDVWFELTATNAGDFGGGSGTDGLYLEAPPDSTTARFQVTLNDIAGSGAGGVGFGSIYYDSASLEVKLPAEISVVNQTGGTTDVSWQSNLCMSYLVQYKDDLEDATWTTLEVVAGDGTVITKSYASGPAARFYRVFTQ